MKGDHVVLDRYMKKLENNHPRYRTRLSQQTWLTMTGSKDAVLRDIQERHGHTSLVCLLCKPLNYGSVRIYVLSQFQMSKKEKEIV